MVEPSPVAHRRLLRETIEASPSLIGVSAVKRTIILLFSLTVFCTWGLLVPLVSSAAPNGWHKWTFVKNWWTGRPVVADTTGCSSHEATCMTGKSLSLGTGFGDSFIFKDGSGGMELRWNTYMCMDVVGGGTANGTPVILWGCHGGP